MKVKIKSCINDYVWYKDKVGEMFEVEQWDEYSFRDVSDGGYISVGDCVIIELDKDEEIDIIVDSEVIETMEQPEPEPEQEPISMLHKVTEKQNKFTDVVEVIQEPEPHKNSVIEKAEQLVNDTPNKSTVSYIVDQHYYDFDTIFDTLMDNDYKSIITILNNGNRVIEIFNKGIVVEKNNKCCVFLEL
jgi:hypothetical protein